MCKSCLCHIAGIGTDTFALERLERPIVLDAVRERVVNFDGPHTLSPGGPPAVLARYMQTQIRPIYFGFKSVLASRTILKMVILLKQLIRDCTMCWNFVHTNSASAGTQYL